MLCVFFPEETGKGQQPLIVNRTGHLHFALNINNSILPRKDIGGDSNRVPKCVIFEGDHCQTVDLPDNGTIGIYSDDACFKSAQITLFDQIDSVQPFLNRLANVHARHLACLIDTGPSGRFH